MKMSNNGDIKVKLFLKEKNITETIKLIKDKKATTKLLNENEQAVNETIKSIKHLEKTIDDAKAVIYSENIAMQVNNNIILDMQKKLESTSKLKFITRKSYKKTIENANEEIKKVASKLEINNEVLKINNNSLEKLHSNLSEHINIITSLKEQLEEINTNLNKLTNSLVEEYNKKTSGNITNQDLFLHLSELAYPTIKKESKKDSPLININAYMEEFDYE